MVHITQATFTFLTGKELGCKFTIYVVGEVPIQVGPPEGGSPKFVPKPYKNPPIGKRPHM
jgi:hypothetical protein